MGKRLRRIGRFYSGMIMGNVGIFLFVGLLSVIFQEQGWLPDERICGIARFVYVCILPVCLAHTGGTRLGGQGGGILAVLLTAGCLAADDRTGILAALLAAPAGGFLWKAAGEPLKRRVSSGMQMLVGNLLLGMGGCVLALGGYYLLAPGIAAVSAALAGCMGALAEKNILWALHVVVEPAKVLFFNNIINHGILLPLGLSQVEEAGSSVLFLVEANPGPGVGLLAALYCMTRKGRPAAGHKRKADYAVSLLTQAAGGLHEVYFPEVLSNLWLLLPLMAAGACGTLWFQTTGCGLGTAASPGSVFTILLLAGRENLGRTAAGMAISAAVSFAGSLAVLLVTTNRPRKGEAAAGGDRQEEETGMDKQTEQKGPVRFIGFICDAGMGSSAMGAALLRRRLAQAGLRGVRAEAFAYDRIPAEVDLAVCQRDFLRLLEEKPVGPEIFAVESLTDTEAFDALLDLIRKRNGGENGINTET